MSLNNNDDHDDHDQPNNNHHNRFLKINYDLIWSRLGELHTVKMYAAAMQTTAISATTGMLRAAVLDEVLSALHVTLCESELNRFQAKCP